MKIDNFANRLKQALEIRKMKQVDLVNKTGIDKSLISNYLSGNYSAKQDNLTALAEALNTSETWLMGYDVPMNENLNNVIPISNNSDGKLVRVPVYGRIPAGIPMEAIEEVIEYEEIIVKQNDHKEYFGLQLSGNSMFPDYKDKDNVIFVKQEDCESGQDCAVMVNGDDATFKKILKKENGILLQPLNPEFEPMFYTTQDIEEKPVRVLGVACEIRRKVKCNN